MAYQNPPRKARTSMEFIPGSPAEVKNIIEAVNLKTFTRFTYLKGDRDIHKQPFEKFPDGFKNLLFTPDGLMFDGADPDAEIILTEPPDVQPGDPLFAGDPTLYFERKPKPGEVTDIKLQVLRIRALAEANPRPAAPEISILPAPRRDNVVKIPAAEKQIIRHNRPPLDVVKYPHEIITGEAWKRVYREMYKKSKYLPTCEFWGYAGKSTKKARCYNQGNEELVRSTGYHKATISRCLMMMKKEKIALQHKRGWKGEKCSMWELPFNLAHVMAWKRKP
jgi:hypothetical protein